MLRASGSNNTAVRLFSSFCSKISKDVFIVSGARTPMGSFKGSLSSISAPKLCAIAVQEAVKRAGIAPDRVEEVYMGNVYSAGLGPGPARQAALFAGLSKNSICTTVNKLCSSGMKSVMLGAQSLMLGHHSVIAAGGMESMSNAPYYMPRKENPLGGVTLLDSIFQDGLIDAYDKILMGNCAEITAKTLNISRKDQDDFALGSYRKSADAFKAGLLKQEIVPVTVPQKKGEEVVVVEDEEYKKLNVSKFSKLPPAYLKEGGTVTAGNASTLNDGGAALILMNGEAVKETKASPIARIVGFADAETNPIDFPIAPSLAIPKLLKQTGVKKDDVALWEINEAFSAVVLANMKILDLDPNKVNVHGGAVSLGHPVGMSGTRITLHLCYVLKPGQKGVASICNGGGGASSIMIEKL